jgi:hypothetical protein
MSCGPRDVLRIWDRHTSPNKLKRHICICPARQLFLRVNSRPLFKPNHLLRKAHNSFLDYDSYVELQQLIRHFAYEIQEAEYLGHLGTSEAQLLCASVRDAVTLSPEHKSFIIEKLSGEIDEKVPS